MRFLVDTNVISEIRHSEGNESVKDRFRRLDHENVFTSAIVFGELTRGVHSLPKGKRKEKLLAWLNEFESSFGDRILPFDREVAKVWGEIVAKGLGAGKRVSVSDGQIAATAIFHDLVVITRNEKHFLSTGAKVWNIWEQESEAK
jgi:predicted nucleic acid-binding protein